MELLIVRHGIAVDREEGSDEATDAARPLTARGRRRFKRSVRGLDRLGVLVDHVLTSPKRRAVETAELLRPIVVADAAFRISVNLVSEPRSELLAELGTFGGSRVAVVGHEPYLGQLIALLTVASGQHGDAVELKKGGVAWLVGDLAPGAMKLQAHLPPRVLRRLR
jgi:phosphohistidine phosphatase